MDPAYMPVAKRTRSDVAKNSVQLAAEIPGSAQGPESPVKIVEISNDVDEVPTGDNKGAASKSRKCEKSVDKNVKNDENKFRFDKEDEKPAEKSDLENEVDMCWEEADMYLYPEDEETNSSKTKADTHDPSKSATDWATLCSQGNHPDVYLDEQVGMVCRSCSVVEEIRYILPPFRKPSLSRRRRDG